MNLSKQFVLDQFKENASGVLSMDKVVARVFEATLLDSPPLRLPLGQAGIDRARAQMKLVADNIDSYESWSAGLDA